MAQAITNKAKQSIMAAYLASGVDLRMGLLKTLAGVTNVPDINFIADMESHADFAEVTASGYARVALTGEASTEDDANDRANVDADNVAFAAIAAGETIVGVFIFEHTGSDATAKVVGIYDISPTIPTNGGPVTINVADFLRAV